MLRRGEELGGRGRGNLERNVGVDQVFTLNCAEQGKKEEGVVGCVTRVRGIR